MADRVTVMYLGRVTEIGARDAVFDAPAHPYDVIRAPRHSYTRGLLVARVELAGGRDRLVTIPGAPPDLAARPPGCSFAPRCARVSGECRTTVPPLAAALDRGRVACFHPG